MPGRSNGLLCGPNFDDLTLRAWLRHRQAVFSQPGNVKFNRLADQAQHLRTRFAYRYTSWKIWHVSSPTRRPAFHHDHVAFHSPLPAFFRPACFRIAFNVPGGTSKLGSPPQ